MSKASDLEKLHNKYDNLKEQEGEVKGGMTLILSQLKKLGINSIEEAEIFIQNKKKEKEKRTKKFDKLLTQISNLLKKRNEPRKTK